jgi:hypothetical protein
VPFQFRFLDSEACAETCFPVSGLESVVIFSPEACLPNPSGIV